MSSVHQLVGLLADGDFHSGEELARVLDLTRAAVWKRIQRLRLETGLAVDAVRGRGYRFAEPLDLLDATRLQQRLQATGVLDRLWVLPTVDSTNSFLARQPVPPINSPHACLCEYQQSGRGRRGRTWISTYGCNLMLSLGWHFDLALAGLSGLSLAVGVALAEMLSSLGLRGHCLKWPNDIHVKGEKLAGILVEAFGEAQGPAFAVVGIGLNVRMPKDQETAIDCPSTDLASQGLVGVARSDLAEQCVLALDRACREYADEGLTPFLQRWLAFDGYLHRDVTLVSGGRATAGRYVGINHEGALLLEHDDRIDVFRAGEVSLRVDGGR